MTYSSGDEDNALAPRLRDYLIVDDEQRRLLPTLLLSSASLISSRDASTAPLSNRRDAAVALTPCLPSHRSSKRWLTPAAQSNADGSCDTIRQNGSRSSLEYR